MRPRMGMVSLSTVANRPLHLANLMELIPRSDKARLIDFVKLRGVVDGSRRSNMGKSDTGLLAERNICASIVKKRSSEVSRTATIQRA